MTNHHHRRRERLLMGKKRATVAGTTTKKTKKEPKRRHRRLLGRGTTDDDDWCPQTPLRCQQWVTQHLHPPLRATTTPPDVPRHLLWGHDITAASNGLRGGPRRIPSPDNDDVSSLSTPALEGVHNRESSQKQELLVDDMVGTAGLSISVRPVGYGYG